MHPVSSAWGGRRSTAALLAAGAAMAGLWLGSILGGQSVRLFCGEYPTQSCLDQMGLFAAASMIPAALAVVLMVLAFALPVLRSRPELRARTLAYSLIAWCIAGFTFVLGGLPAI